MYKKIFGWLTVMLLPACILADDSSGSESEEGLSLQELIGIGLANNPTTAKTWADAQIAAAQLGVQWSTYYPDINLTPFVDSNRFGTYFGDETVTAQTLTTFGPQLTVNYLLFDFGKRNAETDLFQQVMVASRWTHNRQIQTVVQLVTDDYYNYLAAVEQVTASEANLKDANTGLDAARKRHHAGVAEISDELFAQTQVSQQAINVLTFKQLAADTLARLSKDLGISAVLPLVVRPLPKEIPYHKLGETVDELVTEALELRPDLIAAQADVAATQAGIAAAKAAEGPSVTFAGNAGRTYFNGLNSDRFDFDALVVFSLPLYRGGFYQYRIIEATETFARSAAQLAELRLQIVSDVVAGQKDFLLATERVKVGAELVDAAEKSYKAQLSKYKAGTADITTLVTALASLANARASNILARRDWYTALNNLAYATGTLANPEAPIKKRRITPDGCEWKSNPTKNEG